MDSLTHGLTAAILVYALGLPGLIPFAVAGAVILDADTFFARVFDGRPSLYLFTHGGIAHSLAGAAVMALPAWAVAALVAAAVPFFPAVAAPAAFAAVLGGALLHIGLDTLACPGLPLLAPWSDRKYTVGLLPGPSLLLFGVSIAFLVLLALGTIGFPGMILPYVAIICAFLAVRLAAFVLVRAKFAGAGRTIPRVSPFRWLVIRETPGGLDGRGVPVPERHDRARGLSEIPEHDGGSGRAVPRDPGGQAGPVPLVHHDGGAGGDRSRHRGPAAGVEGRLLPPALQAGPRPDGGCRLVPCRRPRGGPLIRSQAGGSPFRLTFLEEPVVHLRNGSFS